MGQHEQVRDDQRIRDLFRKRFGGGSSLGLSKGEKALIFRRRNYISQKEMAERLGMKRRVYSEAENSNSLDISGDVVYVGDLEPNEICLILRRRKQMTQRECAEKMGITRFWYNQMEKGVAPSYRLEEFWNEG